MKNITFLLLLSITVTSFGQSVFINELHYDNSGADINEGIEIAGPAGTDLSTYSIVLYNGSSSSMSVDKTETLSGIITDMQDGYGVINFPIASIQNGAPDGVALVDGTTVIQFLSYEGEFTATDGPANGMTSTDIGVSETSSTPIGESLQLVGSGTEYISFTWNAPAIASEGSINPGQVFGSGGSNPSISIVNPTNNQEYNPGTTAVDIIFTTLDFDLTDGNFVEYTINDGDALTTTSNTINSTTTDGETYTVTLELKNTGGSLSPEVIETVVFSIAAVTTVSNIASLRGLDIGEFVTLASEAVLTFQQDHRNQKYIEDTTGAILIDDVSGVVTTMYAVGDGLTGVSGQIGEFRGVLQFIPSIDTGTATSTGNTIAPQVVTFEDLTSNREAYESEVVQIIGVTFSGLSDGDVYVEETNYMINDGATDLIVRTFNDASIDYIGQNIPVDIIDITGIAGEFNGTSHISPRTLADISSSTLSVSYFYSSADEFYFFPNPVQDGSITFQGISPEMEIRIFNALGKEVHLHKPYNKTVDISDLSAGIYVIQIYNGNNKLIAKKLIVD